MKKLFIIERDPHPEPWEDYSSPFCVVCGTADFAAGVAKSLKAKHPESLFFVREVPDAKIYTQWP